MYPPARSPATSWPPSPAMLADTASEVPGIFREEAGLRTLLGADPAGLEVAGLMIALQEAPETGTGEAGRTQE